MFYARTKHIEIHHYFLQEKVFQEEIMMTPIRTDEQVADIFSKGLNSSKFSELRKQLGITTGVVRC